MRASSLIIISILCVALVKNTHATDIKNSLLKHASPYLAMHGGDPVAWQEWNRETVDRAKQEGKLLYVSSGYFSCHWCHVMQRESYQNKDIAKLLNENFIPVKIDREINSALDSRLIDFVERTQGRAGWPLNAFITPEGYPLVGMTYVPAENFFEVITNLKTKWKSERTLLEKIAVDATAEIEATTSDNLILQQNSQEQIKLFLTQAKSMADELSGGFGQQNKFPSVPQLSVMLELYKKNKDENLKRFLVLTLERMASQGLYDQLEGGFYRYVIDPAWQVPHFEKMLYDNALLASLYIQSSILFENKYFESIAKQTLDFMLSVFRSAQGGFIASLSAIDDKGIEGGYYLWNREELQKYLSEDEFNVVELVWNLKGAPDLDDGYHLVNVLSLGEAGKTLGYGNLKTEKLFASAKFKMRNLRNKRKLLKDEKILAGWNGLTLSAFSQAAKMYKSAKYAEAARSLKKFIYQAMWHNNELIIGTKNSKSFGKAELKDYSYVIKGLSDWLEYETSANDQAWLNSLIELAWDQFYTKQGWILSKDSLLKYKQHTTVVIDDVLPSQSAMLINSTFKISQDSRLLKQAKEALTLTQAELSEQPFWYVSHIFTLHTYQKEIKSQ